MPHLIAQLLWEFFSGLHPRETIRRVYPNFSRVSGECDGCTVFGFNGRLNVTSLFLLFQATSLHGKNVVDLGAGEGRDLASAMKFGAKSVVGYELPANSAHKFAYDAVLRRIFAGIDFNLMASVAQWLAKRYWSGFYWFLE
jgi:ribosomal protein L11 methylase PrmA